MKVDTIKAVQQVQENALLKTVKLGASKEALQSIVPSDKALKDALATCLSARTKKAFFEQVPVIVEVLEKMKEPDKAVLAEIAERVKDRIMTGQIAYLSAGKFLLEGKNEIVENGGTQKDFIAWLESDCEVKRAQAYKLIKCYETYGDNSDFSKVSMRVLYTLQGQANKELQAKATDLAKAGKLHTGSLNDLIQEYAPAPKKTAPPTPPRTDGGKSLSGKPGDTGAAGNTGDTGKTGDPGKTDTDNVIEQYKKMVADLTARLAKIERPAMPALPQFESPIFAVRLGLSVEDAKDKKLVTARYRFFAKLYPSSIDKVSAKRLQQAKDGLLK